MKSNLKKRIIALVLCLALVLSGGVRTLLVGNFMADEGAAQADSSATSVTANSSEGQAVTSSQTGETTASSTSVSTTSAAEPTTVETIPETTTAPETITTPEATPTAAPVQAEMELKHEIRDTEGKLVCTITADIPAETFAGVDSSAVTMEVSDPDEATVNEIDALMKKNLASDKELGNYFFYNILFKVNGVVTEPAKAVKITYEQANFALADVKKATVFYYNAANSVAGNTEAQLVGITQRADKIEELQAAGHSIDTVDQDYDLSEISLKEDGSADKIVMEGRRSTVYGCYITEQKPEETPAPTEEPTPEPTEEAAETPAEKMTFENDDVTITVTADKKGIIPEDSELKVVPILAEDKTTKDQYQDVKEQLEKKAEDEAYDIAGFLAYDISFVDKDGKSVEPKGDVKVSIDYKQEVIPEEVDTSSEANLDVTVMHLEENSSGEVKAVVDMVADETKTATVDTADSAKVRKAEFESDSFSVYTVVWKSDDSGRTAEMKISYVDTNGMGITGKYGQTGSSALLGNQEVINFENDTDYKVSIDGYVFDHAEIRPESKTPIRVYKARINYFNEQDWYDYNLDKDQPDKFTSEYGKQTVYMVYQKISDMDIVITDDVVNSGQLKIAGKLATDADNCEFKWYKSINGDEFKEVTRTRSGDDYNIDENGTWLNLALDEGALDSEKNQTNVKYKVKVLDKSTGTEVAVSDEYNVIYWNQLQNGGFEKPAIDSGNRQTSNKAYKNAGGVWQTTGLGKTAGLDIEIINNRCSANENDDPYKWNSATNVKNPNNNKVEAAEGEQFVELNCDAEGALYQDVVTIKGTPLNYWLSHRARGDYKGISDKTGELEEWDEMYVVIIPTALAKAGLNNDNNPIDTQEEVNELREKSEEFKAANGVYVKEYRDNDQEWGTYSELAAYTPTSYMSRFFFVAGETEHDRNDNKDHPFTFGNFLDNVGFGQQLPPANKGEFTLQVTKRVEGLTAAQFESLKANLEFTITSTTSGAPLNGTVLKASNMTWTITTNADGTISANGSYVYSNQKIANDGDSYVYKVVESGTEVSGYNLQKDLKVIGGKVQEDKASTSVKEKDAAIFAFSNYYTNLTSTVETSKTAQVVDWDQRTYNITLNASSNATSTIVEPVDVVLVFDTSCSMNFRSGLTYYTTGTTQKLDKDKVYYYVAPGASATVMRVYYENHQWKYVDDSCWDYVHGKVYKSGANGTLNSSTQYTFYTAKDGHDRLFYLDSAAEQFAGTLAETSPESRVGLVTFSGSASQDFALQEIGTGNNLATFNNIISNIETTSGTNQKAGLDMARTMLNGQKDQSRRQFVILLTDGCPNKCDLSDIENAASAIKDSSSDKGNRTVMTVSVGLGVSQDENLVKAKTTLKNAASVAKIENGEEIKYVYTADDAKSLTGIFASIVHSINGVPVENATVKDYIDPRFVADEKSVEAAGGELRTDSDGRQYVIWTDQILYTKTSDSPGWSKTFQVKAKDNYIGGNAVTTNGDGSGVTVGDAFIPFKKPTVNVKAVLEAKNYEVTIYKGDSVPTNTTKTGTTKIQNSMVNVQEWLKGQYAGVTLDKFTFTWYSDETCNNPVDMAGVTTDVNTTYYLKVTYNAGAPTADSNHNTTTSDDKIHHAGENDANSTDNMVEATGTYTVNVISGAIQITKKLQQTSTTAQTFNFKVQKMNAEGEYVDLPEVGDLSITVPANTPVEKAVGLSEADLAKLKNLPRGEYQVLESDATGYSLQNVVIGTDTNTKNGRNQDNKIATFALGYKLDATEDTDVISNEYQYTAANGGTLGVAIFTNAKVDTWQIKKKSSSTSQTPLWLLGAEFTLTATEKTGEDGQRLVYHGISGDAGAVQWKLNNKEITSLDIEADTYTLKETKAPTGYAISTVTWTVTIAYKGAKPVITSGGTTVESDTGDNGIYTYYFENTPSYNLPDSGGIGIYWYLIGGTLLMLAAALILYRRNKYEGVLKK